MTNPTAELRVQRQITVAYIETRPINLQLVPFVEVPDGSGGTALVSRPARRTQRFRFVEAANIRADIRVTETGRNKVDEETIIGRHDAVVEVNDRFLYDGATWHVTEILFSNGYEVRATVARYG